MNLKKGTGAFSVGFLAPGFVVYVVFVIVPVILSFSYSLTNWSGVGRMRWFGIQNYIRLFTQDPNYWTVVKNNLVLVLIALVFQNTVGIVLAYAIARTRHGFRAFRSIYFLPVVVSAAATAIMFQAFFNNVVGPISQLGRLLGWKFLDVNWLSNPKTVLPVVASVQVWQYMGIQFVIFLAAIQSIPPDIIESALLDGVSSVRMLFSIVVPLLWEVVQICIIWTVTGCLKAFDHSWLMTWGGPGYASTYLPVYMFRTAFKEFSFSYGTTIAMSILLYSLVFTVLFKRFVSRETVQY
jgi:raffinose/stachyose/melibiose transport system permease protein